jgi:hypothetical protein
MPSRAVKCLLFLSGKSSGVSAAALGAALPALGALPHSENSPAGHEPGDPGRPRVWEEPPVTRTPPAVPEGLP